MARERYPLPPFYRGVEPPPVIPDTIEWDNGVVYFRLREESGRTYLDQTKTPTGFGGSQPTDWDTIDSW